MSMRPGVTMRPFTSRISVCASGLRSRPTPTTLPPAKATSVTESKPCEGSMTRPPLRIVSITSELAAEHRARRANVGVAEAAQEALQDAQILADHRRRVAVQGDNPAIL